MNEQSIFNQALDIDDIVRRAAYLDQACGDNAALRKRVESLLEEQKRSGEFLRIPALEQMREAGAVTNDATIRDEPEEFRFLQPSDVPGSLGKLGHYDIQELIGRGGFGIVFKGFDQRLHRVVAIKVLNPEMAATSPARKRFLREARATAAIRHENVVSIYSVEDTPIPFLVMEYIDGKTLQQLIDETGPLDLPAILRIGQKIADGLEAAHQKGLIHRDLTPGNILIESGTGQVKVVDFGLVRVADDASESQSAVIAGTPLYMSPEQAQGYKLDCRSDLFSLGSVLYVMCSGRPPFRAPKVLAVLKRIVDEAPRHIQEIIPEVPGWLIAIVCKLHAKDPAKRFASAQEVSNLLAHPPVQVVDRANLVADPPLVSSHASRPIRQWLTVAAILLALFSSLGVTEATGITNFRGTVIRLFSPAGTLIVEVDDPDVSVAIDGEELVITGAGAKEIRVKPGQHRITASKDGEVLLQELVTISRNGRQVVRVSREEPSDAIKPEHAPSPSLSNSIWDGPNGIVLSIDRLDGESFQGRITIDGLIDRRIRGTIKGRSIAWLAQDVVAVKGGKGANNSGTIQTDTSGDRIDFTYGLNKAGNDPPGMSGTFTVRRRVSQRLSNDSQAFFAEVAQLPLSEQASAVGKKLAEINPGFDGTVKEKIDNGRVVSLSFHGDAIENLWPVRSLPDLTTLRCVGTHLTHGKLRDLSPLTGMSLTTLDISNSSVSDLSPLKGMRLVNLHCDHTKISDLSPLAKLPLKSLMLWCSSNVTDLSPLSGMKLTHLNCDFTKVADLSPLEGMPLERLSFGLSRVNDLSPLRGMPLRELYCSNTQITDLTPLAGAPLRLLRTEHTRISDLSPLVGMPLKELAIEGTLVSDLSLLVDLPLEQLSLDLPQFDETSEKLLFSMPVKQLGSNASKFRETKIYWQEHASRKEAAEKFATDHSQQPPAKQMKAILGKLREGTSGVGMSPLSEDGVITEARLTLDANSHDISPLRMLGSLRKLTLIGGPGSLDLSSINSLPVETLECSHDQALRNRNVLNAMTTLATINGQSKQDYLHRIQQEAPQAEPKE
ncbi:protein kinase [Blastopirellula sp. J2-11]|uniref:protein kinase domain-containing protein n=1 Tax=Blastopirellula sp. J2-11 TaxID=2943192 RepID=UPI0021C5DDB0|nr:protein kinase [Blastopirellula sp. J2-11]UUO05348.1 protein kinase [Blastopirellula sp. J2-11]